MNITTLWQGLILGFSIAAPVGPIGVLCIRRTLAEGRWAGFLSGLGAATADAVYGAIAAFGLTLITDLLVAQQFWLQLVGGLFLGYLGLRTLFSRPAEQAATVQGGGTLLAAYGSTFFLTITNPMTILAFTAMFLGITSRSADYSNAILLVGGVFVGSTFWWLTLASLVGAFRSRITSTALVWVNRLSGLVLLVFALSILRQMTAG